MTVPTNSTPTAQYFRCGGSGFVTSLIQTDPAGDDTSPDSALDQLPQSGGANGKVYDHDIPAVTAASVGQFRQRVNFEQYAVLGDERSTKEISARLPWFARVSCKESGGLPVHDDTVTNDNVAGSGSTLLTWNIQ